MIHEPMSRIVFCCLPLSGPMLAILPLAKTLRQRGHDVQFIGMADCERFVAPYHFACTSVFEDAFPRGFINQWIRGRVDRTTWSEQARFYMAERQTLIEHERFVESLIHGRAQEFTEALRRLSPDIVVVDVDQFAYWALMVHQSGIPAVYCSPLLPTVENTDIPPFNSLTMPPTSLRSRIGTQWAWQRHFAGRWIRTQLMRLVGVPSSVRNIERLARVCGYPRNRLQTRTMLMPQLDWPTLILCPEALEFPEALPCANHHYVGACVDVDRIEGDFPWERIDARKSLIVCSLGSIAFSRQLFQAVVDVAAREPTWQVVINIGAHLTPGVFDRVPANCILVNGVPQVGLLQRASAMIHHGGQGSTKECAHWGVPQIVFPVGFDQPGMAMRVKYHGLGLVGDWAAVSADYVHALLTQLLTDQQYRARATAMSEKSRATEARQLGVLVMEEEIARAMRRAS
jgi:zeaxanthin glucosyltransferase